MTNIVILASEQGFAENMCLLLVKMIDKSVVTAHPSAQALILTFTKATKGPDLILLDIIYLNEIALLKRRFPLTPVLVCSHLNQTDNMKAACHLGANGFIHKSTDLKFLIIVINLLLSGGYYFPQELLNALIDSEHKASAKPDDNSEFAHISKKLDSLTPRQNTVLACIRDGLSNREIAQYLNISEATAKAHVTAIFKTLNVSSRTKVINAMKFLDT